MEAKEIERMSAAAVTDLTHEQFLRSLGGPTKVARIIRRRRNVKVTPNGVSMWIKRQRIPLEHRACLMLEADELGKPIPANFLGEGIAPPAASVLEQVPFLAS